MDERDRAEIKQHMSVLVEQVRSEIRPVIEAVQGLSGKVESLESRIERLEKRVETEFIETRALIKLSYAELDRRLSTLESGYSELRERIERIEGSRGN